MKNNRTTGLAFSPATLRRAAIATLLLFAAPVVHEPVTAAWAQSFDQLVEDARKAAREDRNKEAADLFERAIKARPADRLGLLREFADQLTYSGRASEAVPLYREVLSTKVSDAERQNAARGLALALLWSGQPKEAAAAWQRIVDAAPDDADARKNLREALVSLARTEAAANDPGASADVFARAIALDPAQRGELLREYAAQLSLAGRAADAVPVYEELLRAEGLSAQDKQELSRNLADAIIVEARAAASRDRNAEAADDFRRAIALDPARRGEVLRDYAEQLTYANRPADAIPLFRELLAKGGLPAEEEQRVKRGLALALLWGQQPDDAVAAWQSTYDANPNDTDARKNLREALVGAGRAAAARDQNAQAAEYFNRAIAIDPARRGEVLREYAEQLTYSGRSPEAVPLFQELLAKGGLSREEELKARKGLALALLWGQQTDDAVAAWQATFDANPNDADARKNLREALITAARSAASRNQNVQAADYLSRAIALDPALRGELLREYAEQLTYSGRAGEAVPLFREIIAKNGLSTDEEMKARRGLALALLWSTREDEAIAAWQRIVDANPKDADARKNLREALVNAARAAAFRNQNARSAGLYARAIALDPSRRTELLREYADQLTYSGRSAEAVPLYRELLATKRLDPRDERQARRGLALAYLWSGRYAEAITGWRAALRANPRDVDARKNLAEALIAAARQAASFDRNAESADLFAQAIAVAPQRRLELAVEYANQLTYSDRSQKAVPIYRQALDSGRLSGTERRSALLGLALALNWSGQPVEAIDVYDSILDSAPDTVEALIGRGSVLTQLDRNKDALVDFNRAAELSPENREARRNAAQSLSYLGRQRLALERIAPLLEGDTDRQTRLVAARAELWKGRPDNAMVLVQQMLEANAEDADALALEREIKRARRPLTQPVAFISTQNNGLVTSGSALRHGISVNNGLGELGAQFRTTLLNPEEGDDVRINGAGFFGRKRFNDTFELNGSLLLNRVETADGSKFEPTYDAWLTMWPNDFLRFDLSTSRSFFDDQQSIADNILIDTVGLSMDYLPDQDLRLTARGSYGFISDGNRRIFAQLEAERRVLRRSNVFVGGHYTYYHFSEPNLNNGYFNTPWLHSIEAMVRAEWQPAPGWDIVASGTAGYEWQPNAAKPIWSAALRSNYAMNDAIDLDLQISHINSADSGGSDAFNRTTLSGGLDIRW